MRKAEVSRANLPGYVHLETPDRLLIDEAEAARRLSISPRHFRKYPIPAVRLGRRKLYDPADVTALGRELKRQPPAKAMLARQRVAKKQFAGVSFEEALAATMAATPSEPCVYIVGAGEYLKIGFTARPLSSRLASLATGSPHPLVLLALVPGTSQLERWFHSRLRAHRREGEWFDAASREQALELALKKKGKVFDPALSGQALRHYLAEAA